MRSVNHARSRSEWVDCRRGVIEQVQSNALTSRRLFVKMHRCEFLLIFGIFLVCASYNVVYATTERINMFIEEIRSLSQLPLKRLIAIKSSLLGTESQDQPQDHQSLERSTALSFPTALPLKRLGSKKALRRYEDWDDKGKDTKISKIFQLAVTALSFLAFGGYLLTLIITAIRRNANMSNPNNVIVFSNLANLQKFKRPKRRALIFDPMENDFETDRMYRGMIMLSQGYSMYNNHR